MRRSIETLAVAVIFTGLTGFGAIQAQDPQRPGTQPLGVGEDVAPSVLNDLSPPPVHVQPVTEDDSPLSGTSGGAHPEWPQHVQPVTDSREPLSVGEGPAPDWSIPRDAPDEPSDRPNVDMLSHEPGPPVAKQMRSSSTGPVGIPDLYVALANETRLIAAPGFLDNDIDLNGEALTATAILDNVDNGSLAAFADGRFNYTPNPGFLGTDSFAYRMRDASNNLSDSVFVTIEVVEGNRNPVGTADRYSALTNTTLVIATPGFLGNDIDPDGEALTATAILDNVDNGSLAAFADGRFNYTPNPGFTGTDMFAYRMRDASNNFSDSVFVTIELFEGNRDPIGLDDEYAAILNTTLSIGSPGFLMNDYDLDGEALTATAILDNVDNGSLAAFADGSFNYTPNPGFTGTDMFAYRMRDASNNFSDTAFVTIQVNFPIGQTPIGTDDQYTVANDDVLSIAAPGFLDNDIDKNGEALTATAIIDNVDNGSLAAFADGRFNYTPNPDFTGTDMFAYRMRDASNNFSDSVFVTIDVLPRANRDPVGTDDQYAALGGTTLVIATPGFLGNDIDPDGEALTATAIIDNVDNGSLAAFADGRFNYTPNPGFLGTDRFAYRMRDASNNFSDSVFVTIAVLEGNRDPIGTRDRYGVLVNTTRIIAAPGFLSNDIDPDGEALTGTAILDNVDNGALAAFADGRFNYTPNPGFTGTDLFAYRMRDASNNFSDSVFVFLHVLSETQPDPVLPVELIVFEGLVNGRDVVLRWTTATETNNAGFDVEHRPVGGCEEQGSDCPGSAWVSVGFVEGAGTSVEEQTYTFVVPDPGPGLHHFRLRQVDFDGSFDFSEEVEVLRSIEGPAEVSLPYPNPFNERSGIDLVVGQDQHVRAELFDVAGRRVRVLTDRRLEAYERMTLSLEGGGLPSGVYLLRVTGENFVETRRAVLSR